MKVAFSRLTPSQILVLSFATAIFVGAGILMLPISRGTEEDVSFLTALYTSTSAICVTGLSIVDISKRFSLFGQLTIMVLIQLGGLGIMTFSSMIMMLIGKKITYQERQIIKDGLNQNNIGGIIGFLKRVAFITISIEAVGTLFLFLALQEKMGFTLKTLYFAVFHSVSAFCNAGFSLFSDNLMSFQSNYLLCLTIISLIFLGGIGFAVIDDFSEYIRNRKISTNITSYLALRVSFILILIGTVLFFILEMNNDATIASMSLPDKINASLFQSVTTRTAGYNTVAIDQLRPGTIFMIIVLMFIGASPGSTGGGIKTTTFGVIFLSIFTIITNKKDVEIRNRRISWEILNRSLVILFISMSYVCIITFTILLYENKDFVKVIFEVVSAFGTVGLSMNFSDKLSDFSKYLIIITMFVGRVGLLTIALALGERTKISKYRFPKENVSVG